MATLSLLARRVAALDRVGLSSLDQDMLMALTDLGNAAQSIIAVADALQELDNYNWLDACATDHPGLAQAKAQAREALERSRR